jgi:formylglycine-generating enzyme required for sulfatase activity
MGKNPSEFKGEKNLPVDTVSWDDCQEFVKKLREKDKNLYRLPTEAEWEYACRAGTKTPFHFGETISTDQTNYNGNFTYGNGKRGVYRQKTTPVDTFPANAWGLYDTHGNLFEWCQDWFGDYPQDDVADPTGPEKGQSVCCVVVRGSIILGAAARRFVAGMGLATVATTAVSVLFSAWTDYAFSFVLLPFALCIFCF